LDFQKISSLLI